MSGSGDRESALERLIGALGSRSEAEQASNERVRHADQPPPVSGAQRIGKPPSDEKRSKVKDLWQFLFPEEWREPDSVPPFEPQGRRDWMWYGLSAVVAVGVFLLFLLIRHG